jgi:hypothetical protein
MPCGSTRKSLNAAYFSLRLKYFRALRRILADPELEGRLLCAGHRTGELAGSPQQCVELSGQPRFERGGIDDRRDLESDLTGLHSASLSLSGQPKGVWPGLSGETGPHLEAVLTEGSSSGSAS